MRLLILNWKDITHPNAGGAEVIAFEYARRFVKNGHDVTFFSRKYKGCTEEEIKDGVKILRRGNKLSVYLHAYLYYRNLKKKPDRVIDMVNTICWQTPLYVPRENRVGYVNQLAKEVFFFELPFIVSYVAYLFEKIQYFFYKNTKILCYSNSTLGDLVDFGIPKKNISTFRLGIDHARYTPGQKSEEEVFIFVARLVKMKRADLCIQAMRNVVKKYNSCKLYIVGTGPDEKRLVSMVHKFLLEKNIFFVNKGAFFVDASIKDKKVDLMRKAWALILPSVKEGWGMVVTEAAACGTPSIVSDVTGLRDSVVRDNTGIILSSNPKPDEISEAMIKIIENSDFRKNLSESAIKFSKNFTWDKSFEEFSKLVLSN